MNVAGIIMARTDNLIFESVPSRKVPTRASKSTVIIIAIPPRYGTG
jgi:hypothetical protein